MDAKRGRRILSVEVFELRLLHAGIRLITVRRHRLIAPVIADEFTYFAGIRFRGRSNFEIHRPDLLEMKVASSSLVAFPTRRTSPTSTTGNARIPLAISKSGLSVTSISVNVNPIFD